MSASSKKKLRHEQAAEKMTQRQMAEKKEAKKLKVYTITFCAIIAVLLIITVSVLAYRAITGSGLLERSTTAATLGEQKIDNAELNYYYIDAIDYFNRQYGSYMMYMGLDATKPLDQQVQDPATGATWADYFLESALTNARNTYAVAGAADAAGYTLTAADEATIYTRFSDMELAAQLYQYPDTETYLKAVYGKGATEKSYREYLEMNVKAQSYYSVYAANLTYTDADLRAGEADKMAEFSNYTYNYYLIESKDYLQGGVAADDGTVTYSDEEQAAALAAAEADAKLLTGETITSAAALDKAIAGLAVNESATKSVLSEDVAYGSILTEIQEWVTDQSRVAGDKTYIPHEVTSAAADGSTSTSVTGYYVVYFGNRNDNNYALPNVRHLLVAYQGGTIDPNTNSTVYSSEEKLAAEVQAQELLNQWKSGDMTEDSFAALANEHSDDGDGTTGGLYTEIYPGQMVTAFNDWCFDESRKSGDTGTVVTPYGCHIMYYSGESDLLYRDYLIRESLRAADVEAWYQGLLNNTPVVKADTTYINTGIILGGNY